MFNNLVYFSVLLFVSCCETSNERAKIVIDQDGGADDALAIFMALNSEKYFDGPQVVGLTTVHGNVNESQVYINTQRILNIAQRKDIPIYRGSATPFISNIASDYFFGLDGLGDNPIEEYEELPAEPLHAALALIQLSHYFGDQLLVVAIGSLTNVGLAVKLDPGFLSRIGRLYVGAGHIHNTKYKEPEFNAMMDPEAYYMVVNQSEPSELTMVPFSPVLAHLDVDKSWRTNVLGMIPTVIMKYINKFERISLQKVEFWSLLDPAVMAVALQESLVDDFRFAFSEIILCGEDRGVTPHNFLAQKSNTRVVVHMDKEKYKQFIYSIFSTPAHILGSTP